MHDLPLVPEHVRALLAVLEIAWVVGVSAWILLERRSPTATLAWILALAAMPVVGALVYLALGPRRFDRKRLRLAGLRRSRAAYLGAWERTHGSAPTSAEQLARLAVGLDAPPPETARTIELLADGDAFFAALERDVRAARHHVHLEFYIVERGAVASRLRDALVDAARAGVHVRFLLDDAGSSSLRRSFLRPLVEAGGRVERFNPVLLSRLRGQSANFRSHRKIVVCDGRVGYVGGMNVSDDHSAAVRGAAAWRDAAIRIEGAAVHGLQLAFLENWSFTTSEAWGPTDLAALRPWFPDEPPGPHRLQIVPSGPDQRAAVVSLLYVAAIGSARERVWLATPYFVPDDAIDAALQAAALRGVDVRLVVPRRTDSRVVDAAGRTYHDALADAGAHVHLYGPPMLHSKVCVVDRELGLVGTANLDNRSFRLNFEVTAVLQGGPAVDALAALLEEELGRAPVRRDREADAPFLSRLGASVARLLAPQL